MRLYPPVWVLVREAIGAFEIGGYRLPARTNFVLCPWVVHRDPRFYDQPCEFRPERWTEEFEHQLPKFAYFPFGGGQRTCIGASLAKMQTSLMLATMAQRFRLALKPGFKLRLLPAITLQPKHGILCSHPGSSPQTQPLDGGYTHCRLLIRPKPTRERPAMPLRSPRPSTCGIRTLARPKVSNPNIGFRCLRRVKLRRRSNLLRVFITP